MRRQVFFCSLIILSAVSTLPAADDSALVGKPAPDFNLQRYDNGNISLSGLKGKVVLVAFWIPSVPECKKAIPKLEGLYSKLRDRGLEIVAVDMKGHHKAAEKFKSRANISFPLVKGNGRMALSQWAVKFTPSYFLIDRGGTVVRYYAPAEASDMKRIEEDILEYLRK